MRLVLVHLLGSLNHDDSVSQFLSPIILITVLRRG